MLPASRVEFFSPQGDVKGIRQVVARFSEQMVPFGDPRGLGRPLISTVKRRNGPLGRWKNWLFDFERDLPAGVRCEFRLRSDLKTLSGRYGRAEDFSFSTGGSRYEVLFPPRKPLAGRGAVFILTSMQSGSGIRRAKRFILGRGIQDHIVSDSSRKEREQILKSAFRYRKPPTLPLILLQSKQRFPRRQGELDLGRGVTTKSGVETREIRSSSSTRERSSQPSSVANGKIRRLGAFR